jgi:sigma-B regulation protein RsbU (phosphoserine phosphatase)
MSTADVSRPISLALLNCTILLVATPDSQGTVAAGLLRKGYHRLLFASCAEQALHLAAAEKPDLVLLDLPVAGVDGVHLSNALRQAVSDSNLPVIAMVAAQNMDEQLRLLSAGGADVVTKPFPDLKLVSHATTQLERLLLIRGLKEFQERIEAELATARIMQSALLPDDATILKIKDRHDVGIAAVFKPSVELGGDLWGAWSIDATRVGVFVCDVTGHGTIAAIDTFRLHTIVARNDFDRSDPGRFLSSLNDRLTGLLRNGQFVTIFYAVFDTRQDCMTYAAAGSPSPLLALPGRGPDALDGSGLPLGIVSGTQYPTQRVPFGPGARLVLQSDAVAEAQLPDGALLGEQEAQAMVLAALDCDTPEAVVANLAQQISKRAGDQLDDDLTL